MTPLSFQDIVVRLVLALVTTGSIGYNRLKTGQAAGLRTHVLVGIGSCIIALVSEAIQGREMARILENPDLANVIRSDGTRLIAQVISGIGFLGAGTIIVTNNITVSGLTTAASLWTVAGIGIASGLGLWEITLVGSVFVLFSLAILSRFKTNRIYVLDIYFNRPRTEMKDLFKIFETYELKLEDIRFSGENQEYHYQFRLAGDRQQIDTSQVSQLIWANVSNVISINFH